MRSNPVAPDDVDVLVTIGQAAELLGVPATTIRSWRQRRRITPARILKGRGRGGEVALYRFSVLRALAEDRRTRRPKPG